MDINIGPSEHKGHAVNKPLISSDPNVMMGKPVITGTRITVESILEKLAAGETKEQIIAAHPRLTPEAIQPLNDFNAGLVVKKENRQSDQKTQCQYQWSGNSDQGI